MGKTTKILLTIAQWLFILCLPVMLLTGVIAAAVNSHSLYHYGFDKYDVGETTGLENSELEKAADELIRYFNSNDESINLMVTRDGETFPLFNEREIAHLKDVKGLIRLDYSLLAATASYVLLYAVISLCWLIEDSRRRLARSTVIGSGVVIGLILLLGLAAVADFDNLFLQFHFLAFNNDLWQLDPATDYMIMLFPQGFWFDATLFVGLATVGLAALTGATGGGYLWYQRRQDRRDSI